MASGGDLVKGYVTIGTSGTFETVKSEMSDVDGGTTFGQKTVTFSSEVSVDPGHRFWETHQISPPPIVVVRSLVQVPVCYLGESTRRYWT